MRHISSTALALLGAGLLVVVPGAHAQAATANTAQVSNVEIQRNMLGSGSPGEEAGGYEKVDRVFNDVYHVPQYLPGTPTAATIWPRVIEVPCTRDAGGTLLCRGYEWLPEYGRGEYLFFRPVLVAAPAPTAEAPGVVPVPAVPPEPRGKPDRN